MAASSSSSSATLALFIRLVAAVVFVIFGVGKFVDHPSEVASFRGYGLPAADAFVYAIGILEIVGGAMLAIGLFVRAAALALAGDMIGAIVVSGLLHDELISQTLAPLMLAAMCFLLWAGAGRWALDSRLHSE